MAERFRSSSGETLVEVLVALVIMGISVTALFSGLAAASRSALVHRDQADSSTYLLRAADIIKAASYDPSCSSEPYEGALSSVTPPDWLARAGSTPQTTVAYWDPTDGKFDAACPDPSETRSFVRMQLVTVSITEPGGGTDSISVAKRILT